MSDTRRKDVNWTIGDGQGSVVTDTAQLAVLMDIRDELKRLNNVFQCFNFTSLPKVVKQIRANTSRIPAQPRKTK